MLSEKYVIGFLPEWSSISVIFPKSARVGVQGWHSTIKSISIEEDIFCAWNGCVDNFLADFGIISWSHIFVIRLCAWDKTWNSSRFVTTFLLFPVKSSSNQFPSSYHMLFHFVNCFHLDRSFFPAGRLAERRSSFSVFSFKNCLALV